MRLPVAGSDGALERAVVVVGTPKITVNTLPTSVGVVGWILPRFDLSAALSGDAMISAQIPTMDDIAPHHN